MMLLIMPIHPTSRREPPADPTVWRKFWFPDACMLPPPDAGAADTAEIELQNQIWLRAHGPTFLLRWSFALVAMLSLFAFASQDDHLPLVFLGLSAALVCFTAGVLVRQALHYLAACTALRQRLETRHKK